MAPGRRGSDAKTADNASGRATTPGSEWTGPQELRYCRICWEEQVRKNDVHLHIEVSLMMCSYI